ncbi:hypothetical protein QYM36_003405 [Artemia franciscana]|uniref:Chorion peroxidase n=1 Tax=Artemia franciscana TaxID=6661 RepID=A0AA88IFV1_ARTSF|nr:hypothetical protein QYM36_003405 [Artemia franciscana]
MRVFLYYLGVALFSCTQASGQSGCALIIPGIGKSSNLDRFHGSDHLAIPGETCVTYDSVNAAFQIARSKIGLPAPKGKTLTDQDIDNLGNVIVETTRIIAHQYGLPRDAVYNGLPLIDTKKTVINKFCPAYLKNPKCEVKRYREYNGMCNNLENPHWGAALTANRRVLPAAYADGISAPREGVAGPLPSPRLVSAAVHRDLGYHDHAVTVFLTAWGQAIDHDLTLTADSKDRATDEDPVCCDIPPEKSHPSCLPIEIPPNDKFYSLFRKRCHEFARSAASLKYECKLGPRTQLNMVTHPLDANFVYGSNKEASDTLRAFRRGMMKSFPAFKELGLRELLPLRMENPDDGCLRPSPDIFCFSAGDGRVNQQPMLTTIHLLLLREHNRIATELGRLNQHWDDERLFQETRHIIAAIVQHITYSEFLPMVLGREVMTRYNLILEKNGYTKHRYDPSLEPSQLDAFGAAAFRLHTLLPSTVERWNKNHKYHQSRRLSEILRRPFDMYKPGVCDEYMLGMMNQVAQAMDESMTQEVTNHLFQDEDKRWGLDLAAINIQRGRDHGIPSYNAFREYCGLNRARSWDDLIGVFTNETFRAYTALYSHPDDLDLWSAGISEKSRPGSLVGPVFSCIIAKNFYNLKFGDRFWYENQGYPSAFTPDQIREIRKSRLSTLVCDNSDTADTVQVYAMVLPDHDINPRVACKSGVLQRMDLSAWIENPRSPSPSIYPVGSPY